MGSQKLGQGAHVASDVIISPDVSLELGDYASIGPGVRILGAGTVKFGDYSKVHSGCFISVPHKWSCVEFGCNTWVGERTVLDGRGCLRASHNVGIGIASHLYTHIAHGDTMAGCKFMFEKEMTIGCDAWFVGQCLVSPVSVGERAVAMLGSTVTKDMLPNTIYAGVPAKDMTEKMGRPWEDRSAAERLALFDKRVAEYCKEKSIDEVAVKAVDVWPSFMFDDITYFNVMTRTYTKKLSPSEVDFMKWFTSWKGRFVPEKDK